VHLHNRLSRSHRVMGHVSIQIGEAAGRECHHLRLVELISHPDSKISRKHRHIFAFGVPMRGDLVSRRHFQADCIVARTRGWVPLDYGQLSSWSHEWRWRSVLDLARSEGILRGARLSQQETCTNQQNSEHDFLHQPILQCLDGTADARSAELYRKLPGAAIEDFPRW